MTALLYKDSPGWQGNYRPINHNTIAEADEGAAGLRDDELLQLPAGEAKANWDMLKQFTLPPPRPRQTAGSAEARGTTEPAPESPRGRRRPNWRLPRHGGARWPLPSRLAGSVPSLAPVLN